MPKEGDTVSTPCGTGMVIKQAGMRLRVQHDVKSGGECKWFEAKEVSIGSDLGPLPEASAAAAPKWSPPAAPAPPKPPPFTVVLFERRLPSDPAEHSKTMMAHKGTGPRPRQVGEVPVPGEATAAELIEILSNLLVSEPFDPSSIDGMAHEFKNFNKGACMARATPNDSAALAQPVAEFMGGSVGVPVHIVIERDAGAPPVGPQASDGGTGIEGPRSAPGPPPPPSTPAAPPPSALPPPPPTPPSAPPPPPPPGGGGATKTYAQKKAEEAKAKATAQMDEYAAAADFASASGHALTEAEKEVIESKGTEAAGTGKYDKFYPTEGYFACRKCGEPIYSAAAKFDSGCGWPAFDKCYEGSIMHKAEDDGTERVEIVCANCLGHLGHIFVGEQQTATDERHCANSRALQFVKGKTIDKAEVTLGLSQKVAQG